jgi:hypothetical protein
MEELTGFASLVGRVVVMELELTAMLDRFARKTPIRPTIPLLGRGVRHSFGRQSGLKIMGPSGDMTSQARECIGAQAFDGLMANATQLFDRSVLQGPATNDEIADLRALEWKPEAAVQVAESRAAQERELTPLLDRGFPWRHDRLRDVVSARELVIEFQHILPRALSERDLVLTDVISDPQSARLFVRAMPSTEVSIELKTAWHRNRGKPWTANDIYDIDAMSLAVPYCDVVVTEKACHHVLNVARLGQQMHTALLRNLQDLPSTLEQWKPKRAPHNLS